MATKNVTLKGTSGKTYTIPASELKQLELEAKQAYNETIELHKAQAGFKSDRKLWEIENKMVQAGKLKYGGIFQVSKKHLVISFKETLFGGKFKGHNFQMQIIEAFGNVPAGEILKW